MNLDVGSGFFLKKDDKYFLSENRVVGFTRLSVLTSLLVFFKYI